MAKKAKRRASARRAASRRKPSVPVRSARKKASKQARTSTRPARSAKRAPQKSAKASGKPTRLKRANSKRAAVRPTKSSQPAKSTAKRAARPSASAPAPSAVRPIARPLHTLSLDRNRRHLPELENNVPTPPSSLDLDRTPSAARSGRHGMREARLQHNETSPELTGGDVDASWEDAYSTGDEAPGGDNPTPDQDRVDDIGKALGVQYRGQRRAESRRQDHRTRSASVGARPGLGRGLSRA